MRARRKMNEEKFYCSVCGKEISREEYKSRMKEKEVVMVPCSNCGARRKS